MKLWSIYLFFGILLLFSSYSIINKDSPETLILGDWEEVSWKYEKLDYNNKLDFSINDLLKKEICQDLIIHEAETWRFNSDKSLTFLENGIIKEDLKWNVKGRGNILELQHKNEIIEGYQVVTISKDKLIIQFHSDLQIKGIVRIAFKRIKNAQEV
ncbi:hypothetical protein VBZ51_07720 [Maribacter sp. HS]|uniref:hypothetical protein n=1 Tax=Maribacter sp. HS TaxID=3110480 RepID=UPI003A863A4E